MLDVLKGGIEAVVTSYHIADGDSENWMNDPGFTSHEFSNVLVLEGVPVFSYPHYQSCSVKW